MQIPEKTECDNNGGQKRRGLGAVSIPEGIYIENNNKTSTYYAKKEAAETWRPKILRSTDEPGA
jgi:hypothetical protein